MGRPSGGTNDRAQPDTPAIANQRLLGLTPGQPLRTRVAGIFLFLPLLAKLQFDTLVRQAGYPGSRMVPAHCALLSLLILKLLDKERRSHVNDFNFDEALALFAGLNILPKKSYLTDYSYRTQRSHQRKLLAGWVGALGKLLFPEPQGFNLDFHAIPYRGDPAGLDNHYIPCRGVAGPSVLTFFAQERNSRVLCYSNANLTRSDQPGELLRFVEFWHGITGEDPQWLYFDSKVVPYAELSRLNQRKVRFVTIRRRGSSILRRLRRLPADQWQRAVIDVPKRRHQKIRYRDETITLHDYKGPIRQLAVDGLGHPQPTLFLTNEFEQSARNLIIGYAGRNGIEDGLGISVDFFHLDCLASEVRLNVDLDAVATVIANGCYRWLASRLHGFDKAKPKAVYRRFVELSGAIELTNEQVIVHFDKRSHNPILREAQLDNDPSPIPWLGGRTVRFQYP